MVDRSFLAGGVLAAVVGLMVTGGVRAEEAGQPASPQQVPSLILNLTNQSGTLESRDKAFIESVKRDASAPRPSGLDELLKAVQYGSQSAIRAGAAVSRCTPSSARP